MLEIVNKFPRNQLRAKWKRTIRQVEDAIKLSSASRSNYNVLLGNLLYYKNSTREFFSVVDPIYLKGRSDLKFTHVILLIDDIQDIYADLTGARESMVIRHCLTS